MDNTIQKFLGLLIVLIICVSLITVLVSSTENAQTASAFAGAWQTALHDDFDKSSINGNWTSGDGGLTIDTAYNGNASYNVQNAQALQGPQLTTNKTELIVWANVSATTKYYHIQISDDDGAKLILRNYQTTGSSVKVSGHYSVKFYNYTADSNKYVNSTVATKKSWQLLDIRSDNGSVFVSVDGTTILNYHLATAVSPVGGWLKVSLAAEGGSNEVYLDDCTILYQGLPSSNINYILLGLIPLIFIVGIVLFYFSRLLEERS